MSTSPDGGDGAPAAEEPGLLEQLDLEGRVQRNPYGAVFTALGVGYVLGGGLFTPTTQRLLSLGLRLAAGPPVRDALLDAAESAVDAVLAATATPKE